MTRNEAIEKVLNIARSELGYHEKASNAMLDDKTANSGSGNYTKYARDLDAVSFFYNGAKQGFPFCDVFHDWCHYKAWGAETAMKVLCQPERSSGAGCVESLRYYKSAGRYYTSPQKGDQVFFQYNGGVAHTGIVESVDGSTITAIEGNTSDQVARRNYNIGSSYIAGYGRPRYELVSDGGEDEIENNNSQSTKVDYLRIGSRGDSVKELQESLIKLGFSCGTAGADGDFGSATFSAVKQYQKTRGLDVDGIVGSMTRAQIEKDLSGNVCFVPTASIAASASYAEENEKAIWDRLFSHIGNAYGAAGAMGNLRAESNLKSTNLQDTYERSIGMTDEQYTAAVDNGTYINFVYDMAGYGLYQATYWSIKQHLLNYAKTAGKSIGDRDMQIDEFVALLKESYPSVWSTLRNATSVRTASDAVLLQFERPADQSSSVQAKRADYGQQYYNKFASASAQAANDNHGSGLEDTVAQLSMLKYGDTGNAVTATQMRLIELGYSCGICGADGDFGNDTLAAVKAFQKDNGLDVDGIVGPMTREALYAETKLKTTAADGVGSPTGISSNDYYLGEIVEFTGEVCYFTPNLDLAKSCKPGKAKITSINKQKTAKHPYHLCYVAGSGSNVYGWVDANSIRKA